MKHTEIRSLALSAAATLVASDDVNNLTNAFVKANGVTKRGPHRMAVLIKKLFTREQMAAWPAIGSSVKDFPNGFNGATDLYSYQEYNPDTQKNVKRSGSFSNDVADHASQRAKEALEALEHLKPLAGKDAVNPDQVDPKYRHLIGDKTKVNNLQMQYNNELKAARTLVRTAMRMIQQEFAFENLSSVKIEYDTDKDGNLTNSPAPIVIVDVANPRIARNFTVGGFLALSPAKAEDNFASIIGTTSKGADDQSNKAVKWPLPKTTTDFLSAASATFNYLDNEQSRRDEKLAMSGKDGDAHILLMGRLWKHLDNLMGDPDVVKRWKELEAGQTKAAA